MVFRLEGGPLDGTAGMLSFANRRKRSGAASPFGVLWFGDSKVEGLRHEYAVTDVAGVFRWAATSSPGAGWKAEAAKLGERLQRVREGAGLSVSEVAKGLGVTPFTLRLIEAGESEATDGILDSLSKIYGQRLDRVDVAEAVGELEPEDKREIELFAEFLRERRSRMEVSGD